MKQAHNPYFMQLKLQSDSGNFLNAVRVPIVLFRLKHGITDPRKLNPLVTIKFIANKGIITRGASQIQNEATIIGVGGSNDDSNNNNSETTTTATPGNNLDMNMAEEGKTMDDIDVDFGIDAREDTPPDSIFVMPTPRRSSANMRATNRKKRGGNVGGHGRISSAQGRNLTLTAGSDTGKSQSATLQRTFSKSKNDVNNTSILAGMYCDTFVFFDIFVVCVVNYTKIIRIIGTPTLSMISNMQSRHTGGTRNSLFSKSDRVNLRATNDTYTTDSSYEPPMHKMRYSSINNNLEREFSAPNLPPKISSSQQSSTLGSAPFTCQPSPQTYINTSIPSPQSSFQTISTPLVSHSMNSNMNSNMNSTSVDDNKVCFVYLYFDTFLVLSICIFVYFWLYVYVLFLIFRVLMNLIYLKF